MDDVENIKSKVDLVEVISSYLPLRKMGRNFSGLCPFHTEKTPSFMVSPERQVFRCFGCSESGDVFTFLEKIEGWDFREVLTELAERVGVKLTTFKPSGERDRSRDKLLAINSLAAKFYSHLLRMHPLGAIARKYLLKRGIGEPLWEKFGLGYAPAGWDNTLNFFAKRGFALSDLSTSGLVIARQSASYALGQKGAVAGSTRGGFYDRFRDRLIFPLKDSRGSVLGFSARILRETSEQAKEPKYINSPETPIFNKGSLLFGLDVTRHAIREKNEAVLVEGEFDVLSAYQAGVENVVASKGTALTQKQVVILSRIAESVTVCFDTDLAGDAAARRGIFLLDLAGVGIKVVRLGKYKDPDEFAKNDSEGFKKAISGSVNVYDYFIESATRRYDPKSALGKKKIGGEILPILAKISDDLVRAHYIAMLSRLLDLDVALVAAAIEKKQGIVYPSTSLRIFDPSTSSEPVGTRKNKMNLEEYFLALFVFQDEVLASFVDLVSPSDFEDERARAFWQWVRDIMRDSKKPKSLRGSLTVLPKQLNQFVDDLYLLNISPTFTEKELCAQELIKVAKRIKHESYRRQLSMISRKIKAAQVERNSDKLSILAKQFDELSRHLKEVI